MNSVPSINDRELMSLDPELDRLYREHALAVALCGQIPQPENAQEIEREPKRSIRPLDECSSTFAVLKR
jgi:hypothetical protein